MTATRLRIAVKAAGLVSTVAAMSIAQAADPIDHRAVARLTTTSLGLPPLSFSASDAPNADTIALGRKLFFDRRLSANGTMSCGMCHIPEQGFAGNEVATSVGVEGRSGRRNAPTVLNVAYQKALFHDGRGVSLETQVIGPFLARREMANPSIGLLVAKIGGHSDYDGLFEQAFDAPVSIGAIGRAIAWWQRSLLAGGSPFDRWYFGGKEGAMSADARAGFDLFIGEAGCVACHTVGEHDTLFSDQDFHDTGIGFRADAARRKASGNVSVALAPGVTTDVPLAVVRGVGVPRDPDGGRAEVTGDPADQWRYKTPSLRNVALTAPYMHDGSLPSLDAVVRYYDGGGAASPGRDPRVRPLGLSEGELLSLVRFLESLTSPDIADLIADARAAPVGH